MNDTSGLSNILSIGGNLLISNNHNLKSFYMSVKSVAAVRVLFFVFNWQIENNTMCLLLFSSSLHRLCE